VPIPSLPVTSPLLSVRDVSVNLGGLQILQDVSLQVQEGEVIGLIGPNGAGKTTVFNVISGFVKADSGTISWEGRPRHMHPHSLAGLGIARTLQGVGLFDSMSVLDNLLIGATGTSEAEARSRARGILYDMGIGDTIHRLPTDLPYPLRKRVALGRALMAQPRLLMLDEPAGGLAQEDISSLAALIKSWAPRKSVLLVEHHMDFVMQVCDHIYVLDAGRIIANDGPEEVQKDPLVRAAYLGEEVVA
jgi:branched-chain amino acid transport system ATP-binding protein